MIVQPRILICTDFSDASDRALRMASRIGQALGGDLLILHVAEIGFYFNCTSSQFQLLDVDCKFRDSIQSELINKVQNQLEKCDAPGRPMVIFESNPSRAIDRVMEEEKVGLVVMGDKGKTGMERFLLGSLTRKTVSSSEVPVLVVKKDSDLNKVAALVDSEGNEITQVLDASFAFARNFLADLHVISIIPDAVPFHLTNTFDFSTAVLHELDKDNLKKIASMIHKIETCLSSYKATISVSTSDNRDIPVKLVGILHDKNINLAVLKKHHKSWPEKNILGSVSTRVLELFQGNILVL